jgi:hypothetical protein
VPPAPTATTRVGELNAAAKRACDDGVISVTVSPPSVVRRSLSPLAVVSTHVFKSTQRMEVRSWPLAAGLDFHVFPPSSVTSRVLGPTAKPCCASKNHTRRTVPGSIASTGFHELPASVVE